MKKLGRWMVLAVLMAAFGCCGAAHAEVIPPYEPGQQIGYPAAVLCETLSLREKPDVSSRVVKTLTYGDVPIVVGADLPEGPEEENGFVYCTLGDAEDDPCGWIDGSYLAINPAWYVTEAKTAVYAWNEPDAPKIGLLDPDTWLPILKEEDNWYLVSLRAAVGWIHK